MTTKAIEAGAREAVPSNVINQHIGWLKMHAEVMSADNWRDIKLYIESQVEALSEAFDKYEAAIASGELVPASAVAAERERCAQIADRAAERDAAWAEKYPDEARRCEERELRATTIAASIRALEPASGAQPDIQAQVAGAVAEMLERCAQAAEGPLFGEKWRGRDGHNWWHEKQPPGSMNDYGNGRHDAAAAIRQLPLPACGEYVVNKPRPSDCAQPMQCGWKPARTEPEINLWLCDVPGCKHMLTASTIQGGSE